MESQNTKSNAETGGPSACAGQKNTEASTMESVESKVTPRQKSEAWNHFKKSEIADKAKCNHCGDLIKYKSAGSVNTCSMLNHMKRCKKLHPEIVENSGNDKRYKQSTLNQNQKNKNTEFIPSYLEFDNADCRKSLVRFIIKDELPFRIVEKEGFREFAYTLQPRFFIPSRRTVTRDCISLFLEEKKKLKLVFEKHKGSVSLTTNTWTSVQNINYMCLTAHYIDENWNLHKKIINFCQILSQIQNSKSQSEENTVYQSELESYLAEGCVRRSDNFDILLWWKKDGSKYRILSQMARDLLAIPVSSVASESVFSTSGRVIDSQRSSLTPRTVEALLCTQDWIQSDYEPPALENSLSNWKL